MPRLSGIPGLSVITFVEPLYKSITISIWCTEYQTQIPDLCDFEMLFRLKHWTAVRSQTDVALEITAVHETGCSAYECYVPSEWLLLSTRLIQGLLATAVTLERSKHFFHAVFTTLHTVPFRDYEWKKCWSHMKAIELLLH